MPVRTTRSQIAPVRSPAAGRPSMRRGPTESEMLRSPLGNQTVQRLLLSSAVQAKLSVSQPSDPSEREADRVADEVMRIPEPGVAAPSITLLAGSGVQTKCAGCKAGGGTCAECAEEEKVQRRAEANGPVPEAGASLVPHGGGQPLSAPVRSFFEARFGRDFSGVRVHTGAEADASARSIQALAYTRGSDIVFRSGQYVPDATAGRRLLAHELTHVAQQRRTPGAMIQRLSDPDCGNTTTLPMSGSCSSYLNTCNSETFVPASSSALHVKVSVEYDSPPGAIGPEDFSVQVYKCGFFDDTRIGSKRLGPNIPGCLEFTIASVTPDDKYYLKIYSRSNLSLNATYNVWQGSRPSGVAACPPSP